jgi:hypothetical protein
LSDFAPIIAVKTIKLASQRSTAIGIYCLGKGTFIARLERALCFCH